VVSEAHWELPRHKRRHCVCPRRASQQAQKMGIMEVGLYGSTTSIACSMERMNGETYS